ncbi:putative IQ motif, EF-hand binding protein [Helianthus annuus]|nr:putative IQ motif, EF-hand binding protein [Helianthus annuus]
MGITGELVRSAFSKNRSFGTTHDTNVMRNNAVERKRWASVRSYLCGDELSSILAEEDLGSRRSSKAAVNSVVVEDYSNSARTSKATVFSSRIDDDSTSVKGGSETTVTQPISDQNSSETLEIDGEKTKLPSENKAAVVIQSAFRSFLARRQTEDVGDGDLESVATSVEVQTGNSGVEVKDESESFTHRVKHHKSPKVQTSKLKPKEWDDSTVSSNIKKMRIQNRLEASTRRERALAYAFSQQLRICSKKKQSVRSGNEAEANMSWSWLERWMATRQHDTSFGDISKQFEQLNGNQKLMVKNRVISDLAGEEKESCGSNEVSIHFDNVSLSSKTTEKSYCKPVRNRVKAASVTRRKKPTRYGLNKESCKVNKQGEREIRCEHQQ